MVGHIVARSWGVNHGPAPSSLPSFLFSFVPFRSSVWYFVQYTILEGCRYLYILLLYCCGFSMGGVCFCFVLGSDTFPPESTTAAGFNTVD